ncbi:MAG: ATP-binding protein [Mycobacterium leprae]
MRWLRYLHNRTNLFAKVMVANAVVMAGTILSIVLIASHAWQKGLPQPGVAIAFVIVGLAVSLGVNAAILRLAFQPLFTFQTVLDRVRRGDFSARVPEVAGDSNMAHIAETANLMLDRLTEHRQAVAAQVLRALEDERKRIARELHDETSQSLTSIMVNLDVIEQQLTGLPDEVAGRLRLTREIAKRTLDETRRLMFDLRPAVLDDLGLVPALRWFFTQRVQPMGMPVGFEAVGFEERLPDDLETALFRIMQEAITNAVKHSRGHRLEVSLTRANGEIVGTVQDDGVGFNPVQAISRDAQGGGMGLFGMQERAALVGGSVQVHSAPGRGTTVRVMVPDRVRGREAGEQHTGSIGR